MGLTRSGVSLGARLAALQIGSIVIFLLVASLLLYRELARDLDLQDAAFAAEKIDVLRRILADSDRAADDLRPEIVPTSNSNITHYWVRVVDGRGKSIIETPGFGEVLRRIGISRVPRATGDPNRTTSATARDGEPFLLVASSARDRASSEGRIIELVVSKKDDAAIMNHYRRTMLSVLLLAAAISVPTALLLTRRGLRPLERMTEQARNISASRLHERIRPEQWPAELIALARAFDDMLRRLEESFDRLSQFSADLAHELRTPINNMMGELEVSFYAERSPAEYRDVLASTLEECARLNRIVDGLLFLARSEAAERRIERQALRAEVEIAAVTEFFEALTEQKQLRITTAGAAPLYGEPTLVRRALTNLLANAVRHTPEGGEIALSARLLPDGATELEVRDSGRGIAGEHMTRIFDRFYRADPSRTASSEGTGLGLSIVKSIMDLHGGSASIDSEIGRGTVARLKFPPAEHGSENRELKPA